MVQIKLVQGNDLDDLNTIVNEVLATIDSDAYRDTKFDFNGMVAAITYELIEEWKKRMCCECKYWDDGGDTTPSGICHETGQRRRFNCKACQSFKDVRG